MAAVLSVTPPFVGAWAPAAPSSFYADFPFPGRHWVRLLGPYNEHLVRDVGGLYLALLVITVWAIAKPAPPAPQCGAVKGGWGAGGSTTPPGSIGMPRPASRR